MEMLPLTLIGVVVLFAAGVMVRRKRIDKYDLKRLWDEPLPDPDPIDELLDDRSGPYCHSCDEPHDAGINFCRHCGRKLG